MRKAAGSKQQGASSEGDFEAALTRALRRVEAPVGFAESVAAQAHLSSMKPSAGGAPGRLLMMRARPKVWVGGGIAAALVAGLFVAQDVHQRREREMANRQFALSMQIEERAIEHTRQQLEKAGVPLE